MSDYVVYKKEPCKDCKGQGTQVWNDMDMTCPCCGGAKAHLSEVDLKKAIIDILEKDNMWIRRFTEEISYA